MTVGFAKYTLEGEVLYRPFHKYTITGYDCIEYGRTLDVILSVGLGPFIEVPEHKMPVVVASLRLNGFEISGWQA